MTVRLTPRNTTLCAVTRLSRAQFVADSLVARSLRSFPREHLPRIALIVDNASPHHVTGLAQAYNDFLAAADDDDFLVLVHDDVFFHDWFLLDRLSDAFERFDVIGVAGNKAPDLNQPSWVMKFHTDLSPAGTQDSTTLSGAVGHGDPTMPPVSRFGPAPAECVLLDGLFLAVSVRRLRETNVAFDPRFDFHCYDLDFCRTALAAGLRVGTWPIAMTHASVGNFASTGWKQAAAAYLRKWR